MSNKIFKPHRGRSSVMANQKKNIILEAGEMFIELPDNNTGNCKMKIGDGNSTYENLPYAMGIGNDETLLYNALSRYENPNTGRCYTYQGDLNDITQNCIVNTDGSNANLPSGVDQWGFVITLVHSNQAGYASQIYITMNVSSSKRSIWVRDKDPENWYDWRMLPNVSGFPKSKYHYLAGDGTWSLNTANLTTTYTSEDDSTTTDIITSRGGETAISTMDSTAKHSRLFNKLSRTVLNTRKLINTVKRIWNTVANMWVSGVTYSIGQVIVYTDGHTYICKKAHTSSTSITPTNTTYWEDKTIGDMIATLNNDLTKQMSLTRIMNLNTTLESGKTFKDGCRLIYNELQSAINKVKNEYQKVAVTQGILYSDGCVFDFCAYPTIWNFDISSFNYNNNPFSPTKIHSVSSDDTNIRIYSITNNEYRFFYVNEGSNSSGMVVRRNETLSLSSVTLYWEVPTYIVKEEYR